MRTHGGRTRSPLDPHRGNERSAETTRPVSNEDTARVAAGLLENPEPHVGQTYRSTGPEPLTLEEVAETTSVLDRRARYVAVP